MRYLLIIFVTLSFHTSIKGEENLKQAYFAGGCFWCVEEYFDQVEGVVESISGYSGGFLKNPTYKKVTYEKTGHVETVKVVYDPKKVNYEKLLNVHLKNIDPFDISGQFCDKGDSYRSVVFYKSSLEKKLAITKLNDIETKFNKKPTVLIWKFKKFYSAENYHQDFYEKNFIRYLIYKNGCKREETLKKIWN
tara:strand:- start:9 stop:584 length:576 start_codon:yes stop_codon:yes gene_type:complete